MRLAQEDRDTIQGLLEGLLSEMGKPFDERALQETIDVINKRNEAGSAFSMSNFENIIKWLTERMGLVRASGFSVYQLANAFSTYTLDSFLGQEKYFISKGIDGSTLLTLLLLPKCASYLDVQCKTFGLHQLIKKWEACVKDLKADIREDVFPRIIEILRTQHTMTSQSREIFKQFLEEELINYLQVRPLSKEIGEKLLMDLKVALQPPAPAMLFPVLDFFSP